MARLRYNGLATTLGGSLTNSATSVTFAAALTHSGGTSVPTISGSDYLPLTILTSAGAVSEVVYLTAYTSGATTGTIARGKEGTTGVSHSSGDKVVNAFTLLDLGRNFDDPGESVWTGDLGYDLEFNDDGSSLPSGWSWMNQGTSTWATSLGAGVLTMQTPGAAGDNIRGLSRAMPTETSWTATIKVKASGPDAASGGAYVVGFGLRESSSGKIIIFGNRQASTLAAFNYTNNTTFSANTNGVAPASRTEWYPYLRIRRNSSTSYDFQGSSDGSAWTTLISTFDVTSVLTPDQLCMVANRNGSGAPLTVAYHWFRVR